MKNRQHPNILWLMTDEQRTDSLGCYGSPWARTPCLDRLAAEGTLFESAVTPAPVCVPARVSLLSARRPHQTGIMSNRDREGDWTPLTHTFRDHGYQTATFGKQHYFRPDAFETTFDKVLSDAVHYFHYEEPHREEDHDVVRFPREDREWIFGGRFPEAPDQTAEAQVVAAAQAWLDGRDRSAPFFLRLSFNGPHTPVAPPEPFDTLIDPDDIDVPGAFDEPVPGRPRWESEFLQPGQNARMLSEDQLRRAHQCYYGLASFVDSLFAVMLDWMAQRGLLDNTVIAFNADHGTHLGDHAMMQKQSFYEPVVSVPLVFRHHGPDALIKPNRIRTPVETLSLMPTLLELAGLPVPDESRDLSLAATLTEGREPPARAVFSEFTQATWGYRPDDRLVMVREGPWKLALFHDGPGTDPFSEWADASLYNLDEDPLERSNLIHAPEHRAKVGELAGVV